MWRMSKVRVLRILMDDICSEKKIKKTGSRKKETTLRIEDRCGGGGKRKMEGYFAGTVHAIRAPTQ